MKLTGTNITIEFTNTKTDEVPSNVSGIYIDYDGHISGSAGSLITIRGGDNTGAHTVSPITPSPFFMSNSQRISLYSLLRQLSTITDSATIVSSNGSLQELANAAYSNFCG